MVTRDLSSPYKTDGRGRGSPARPYHCACCTPPRQIYYRLERPVDRTYHEHDHTPAVAAASLAAARRDLAARRRAASERRTARRAARANGELKE